MGRSKSTGLVALSSTVAPLSIGCSPNSLDGPATGSGVSSSGVENLTGNAGGDDDPSGVSALDLYSCEHGVGAM